MSLFTTEEQKIVLELLIERLYIEDNNDIKVNEKKRERERKRKTVLADVDVHLGDAYFDI
jgi:hypothetical protein